MKTLQTAFLLLIVQMVQGQQPTAASIDGVVVKSQSNEPLAKAKVELRTGNAVMISTTTDREGRFLFPDVRPGNYRLVAIRDGYVRAEYGQRQFNGPGLPLILGNGQRASGIRLEMTAGAVVSGRVTDDGRPLGQTVVAALSASMELGQRVWTQVLATTTNDLGDYDIFWLPPGRYYIVADIRDTPNNPTVVRMRMDGALGGQIYQGYVRFVFSRSSNASRIDETSMHIPTFYPSTPDWHAATPIDLIAGSDVHGANINAHPIPALHIRGTVSGIPAQAVPVQAIAAAGVPPALLAPVQGARRGVTPFPVDAAFTSLITPALLTGTQFNDAGLFDVSRIYPGSYVLQATAGNLTGRAHVDIRDRDVNGITIALVPTVGVSGRVSIERQTPVLPDPGLASLRITLSAEHSLPGEATFNAAPAANGSFRIPAAPANPNAQPPAGPPSGDYRVSVFPLLMPQSSSAENPAVPKSIENAYVKSIRLGDVDVLNDGLHLTETTRGELTVVIGTNPGAIEGRVFDAAQKPSPATTVVLIPDSGQRFHVNHKMTSTDVAGHFQIPTVPPGDYKLFAWETVEPGAWQDPDFVSRFESAGKKIHIEEGSMETVDLISIP